MKYFHSVRFCSTVVHGPNTTDAILRPRALIDALPIVSSERVDEVRNEYPEFVPYLDSLKKERSPIDLERLGELWNQKDTALNTIVSGMVDAGILQEYRRGQQSDTPRYSVAELYLYGLQMTRLGQR